MDSSADSSNPPTGTPDEPGTSQMKAVSPSSDVVWPEDPFAADDQAATEEPAAASPEVMSPAAPPWSVSASGEPPIPSSHEGPAPLEDDPHTAPFVIQPMIGKTQPPTPATSASDNGANDTKPPMPRTEEVLKTAPPVAAAPTTPPSPADPEPEPESEPEAASMPDAQPVEAAAAEPSANDEPVSEPEARVEEAVSEPEAHVEEPASEPDLPITAPPAVTPVAAVEEAKPAEPLPAPVVAPAKPPEPEEDPLAAASAAAFASSSAAASPVSTSNPAIPAWAPKFGGETEPDKSVWPGSNLPSWAPIAGGPATEPQRVRISSSPSPAAPAPAPTPAPTPPAAPVQASQPPPPPVPTASRPAAAGPAPAPAAPTGSKPPTASWEVVEQKQQRTEPAFTGPSPEDKSYAEWFAWAKRSGAPASACHAAAQGAFRALSSGQDMGTAVKWATLAMASPPGLVSQSRQLYCAWFSLGNIDLQFPTPTAHAFATGAIQALDSGADSMVAHQMGLQAAGIAPHA